MVRESPSRRESSAPVSVFVSRLNWANSRKPRVRAGTLPFSMFPRSMSVKPVILGYLNHSPACSLRGCYFNIHRVSHLQRRQRTT
ncbi:hypothetical protein CO2235_U600010 [Cupriavidus oxalaticus]|uniref:Uncharacterized protein n=1 Tax=Cupriavidus oxalaticus TaxID=96344 RepID=A0A375FRY8_9BURK|nr:hypothetical protein CO2235_U600010 [Cupriavidus oxalaticus]